MAMRVTLLPEVPERGAAAASMRAASSSPASVLPRTLAEGARMPNGEARVSTLFSVLLLRVRLALGL